jgi:hypothetical protein
MLGLLRDHFGNAASTIADKGKRGVVSAGVSRDNSGKRQAARLISILLRKHFLSGLMRDGRLLCGWIPSNVGLNLSVIYKSWFFNTPCR